MSSRIVTIASASALAVAGSAGAVLLTASSAGATTPTCRASQLVPHYVSQQGAAGHFYDLWRLTDVGATCQMRGFVAAINFGPDGRALRTAVSHSGTPGTVTLAHGQHASFNLGYVNPVIGMCTPENATNMAITAPGAANPVLGGRGEKACNGDLIATPVVFGG